MRTLLIAVAGALGTLARYGIGLVAGPLAFPWATLGINVAGSFLLGVLLSAAARVPESVVLVLGVGFLGAFTTFSTFSNETLTLIRADRGVAAASYIIASVLLGVGAAAGGFFAMRFLTR